jgi:lipoate-protein ligase B
VCSSDLYARAHALQLELVAARQAGRVPDTLLLLEHEAVITLGRHADPAGVLAGPEALAAEGIGLHRVERGGEATYHGPGQVVGYPIVELKARRLGVRRYVAALEEAMARAAAAFGVEARSLPGRPGVYTRRDKLGAVGVAVSRGVTFHGFAFNACPELSHFRLIVPCGQTDIPPTSLAEHLAERPSVEEAADAVLQAFREVLGDG